MNKKLAAFAAGFALMLVAALAHDYGLNIRWEFEAFNHRAGYFASSLSSPNKLEFRWFR